MLPSTFFNTVFIYLVTLWSLPELWGSVVTIEVVGLYCEGETFSVCLPRRFCFPDLRLYSFVFCSCRSIFILRFTLYSPYYACFEGFLVFFAVVGFVLACFQLYSLRTLASAWSFPVEQYEKSGIPLQLN